MLQDILLRHFDAYPLMEPQDAVKLIYQQEFGPEHLIRDGEKTLSYLKQEAAGLGPALPGERLYELIGGGLCRVNLRPWLEKGLPLEELNRLFVETAQSVQGDKKRFSQGLKELAGLAEAGETPFEPVLLDLFLARYPRSMPPVHHSEAYRLAYQPAYRVVAQRLVKAFLSERRGEGKA